MTPVPDTPASPAFAAPVRRRWRVYGIVQGVGFRPWVCRTARALDLKGEVGNDAAGVLLGAPGGRPALGALAGQLQRMPAPARLEEVATELLRASGVVMDGGTLPGAPSAVIDVVGPVPLVLRRAPGVDEVLERLGP